MGSRMLLLLVVVLLLFTNHSQGVPETHEKSSITSTFTDASAVGQSLTTANPINTPRQYNIKCKCEGQRSPNKGKGRKMMNTCSCKRSGKHGKLKQQWIKCQKKNKGNLKKCIGNLGPSTPI